MERGDSIQHAMCINKSPQIPTAGTHSRKRKNQEIVALVGPMRLEESLQIRNNRISIPITVSGTHSHVKIDNENVMYNLPTSRGTTIKDPTLQV